MATKFKEAATFKEVISASVTNLKVAMQTGTTNTVYASWSFSNKYVDHYTVSWKYNTGDGVWFDGGSSDVTVKNATYSMPSNARQIKVTVKPIAKTYKKNGKDTKRFTSVNTSATFTVPKEITDLNSPTALYDPEVPSAPTVTITSKQLTITVDGIQDEKTSHIELKILKDGVRQFASDSLIRVTEQRVQLIKTNFPLGTYRVCCRAYNSSKRLYSDWSTYSSESITAPAAVSNVKAVAATENSVKVTWNTSSAAERYEVQWTTDKTYFDTSSQVSSGTTEINTNTYYATGLDPGDEYFFRVRAVNSLESPWSSIVSCVIGTKPAAPTTWTLSATALTDEDIILYWTHNSEDGSHQTQAKIQLTVNGIAQAPITLSLTTPDDEEEKIYSYQLKTSVYSEGAEIKWAVQTKGIHKDFSDWSVTRTIDIYAKPWVNINLDGRDRLKWLWDPFNFNTDNVREADSAEYCDGFPYVIIAEVGPTSQKPVTYHFSITAEDGYEAEDHKGEFVYIAKGEEIFARSINTSENPYTLTLMPSDVTFESMETYKVTVTVSMDSGLTASEYATFTVAWDDYAYAPNAELYVDKETYTATITPFCTDETGELDDKVVLGVYRREYDGNFTEIATELENSGIATVIDPHPALDFARYRIVARNIRTNDIGYTDLPGEPVNEPSIIIQWDERWSQYDYTGEQAEFVVPPWTGSLLRLPFNIDISESHDKDVSLVEYIGRRNPVSYYGTQRGEGGTWTTEFDKRDKETIYALRRLADYDGDVYVREPSGIGYWANIKVNMSIQHLNLIIPVTFEVKRVEGGL